MDISLSRLRQLVAVARTRSFSRAAKELNLSQPALSRSIATLEQHYGLRIFDRNSAGVAITSAGTRIIFEAESLLRHARTVEQNLKLLKQSKIGRLSIGLGPLLASVILPHLTEKLFYQRPQIELKILVRAEDSLIQSLLSEEIDLLICPENNGGMKPPVATQILGEIVPACIVRSSHPLVKGTGLKKIDLNDYPVASPAMPHWIRDSEVTGGVFICDNYHVIRDSLYTTDLIGICPLLFVPEEIDDGRLVVLDIEDLTLPSLPIVAGHIDGRTISSLAKESINICRDFL